MRKGPESQQKMTRRDFLKMAGITAAGAVLAPKDVVRALANTTGDNKRDFLPGVDTSELNTVETISSPEGELTLNYELVTPPNGYSFTLEGVDGYHTVDFGDNSPPFDALVENGTVTFPHDFPIVEGELATYTVTVDDVVLATVEVDNRPEKDTTLTADLIKAPNEYSFTLKGNDGYYEVLFGDEEEGQDPFEAHVQGGTATFTHAFKIMPGEKVTYDVLVNGEALTTVEVDDTPEVETTLKVDLITPPNVYKFTLGGEDGYHTVDFGDNSPLFDALVENGTITFTHDFTIVEGELATYTVTVDGQELANVEVDNRPNQVFIPLIKSK